MSHRTEDLDRRTGLTHVIRELRYNEVARQSLAVVLLVLYASTSDANAVTAAIGLAAALLGMLVRLFASGYIVKNRELARSGPYAFVRHPLYTGNILLILGFSIANTSYWAIPLALAFFWFYYPPAIEYEDRKLRGIFGEAWQEWASRTPALAPRLPASRDWLSGHWSLATSLRRNGEILVSLFVLVCAYLVIAPFF